MSRKRPPRAAAFNPVAARAALALLLALPFTASAADRLSPIFDTGGKAATGGFSATQQRAAVQMELSLRPPTPAELGVKLPQKTALRAEQTARQMAEYDPAWRVYEYSAGIPKAEFVKFFQAQGLTLNATRNVLVMPGPGPDGAGFIDGLQNDPVQDFRIWRKP
ncbi:MAG: hypothetical protein ABW051_05100 [Burkholderiaceae bacterium]